MNVPKPYLRFFCLHIIIILVPAGLLVSRLPHLHTVVNHGFEIQIVVLISTEEQKESARHTERCFFVLFFIYFLFFCIK